MKIAFSTLACPDWSWQDITSAAKDFGYDGVEVRGRHPLVGVVAAQAIKDEVVQVSAQTLIGAVAFSE